jgi:hypothetical protein
MLRRVAPVRTDVSVNRIASIIRVTSIGKLEATLAATSYRNTLHPNIPADGILFERTRNFTFCL